MAVDGAGNLYIADTATTGCARWTPRGRSPRSPAPAPRLLRRRGPGDLGPAQYPTGVAVDGAGNLYIADANNPGPQGGRPGTITTVAGTGTPAFSGDGGPATSAELRRPAGAGRRRLRQPLHRRRGNSRVRKVDGDTVPPETTITSGPSGATNDPTPTFSFSSSEPARASSASSTPAPTAACSSPKTTAHLADGPHTFYVRAKDAAGNVDPTPASRTFTVRTASVSVSGSALVVTAAPGAKDNLQITRPSASIVRVTDFPAGAYTGSGVHTGAGCTRSGDYTANCLASGDHPDAPGAGHLRRSTGRQGGELDRPPELALRRRGRTTLLTGGSARDILNGGAGADVLKGMDGNDLLQAHDGASDQTDRLRRRDATRPTSTCSPRTPTGQGLRDQDAALGRGRCKHGPAAPTFQ